MTFVPTPILPGDLFESASKLGAAFGPRLIRIEEPGDRAAVFAEIWREMSELGWPSVAIPEALGGVGGTLLDVAALVEGAARYAFPMPIASAFGIVPALLTHADAAGAALLAGLVNGEHRIAAALAPLHGTAAGTRLRACWSGTTPLLNGALIGIECPPAATQLIIACEIDGESVLLLQSLNDEGVALQRHERIDGRPTISIAFTEARLPAAAVLARGDAARAALLRAMRIGALLSCVEAVAGMGSLLEQTIAYLKGRVQFDAPLSSFQVLRHRVAELFAMQESARAQAADLLERIADGTTWPERDIDLAKLHIGPVSRRFAATAIQLHGGMGMTEELPASRLAKRLLMVEFEYGDTAFLETRLLGAAA